MNASTDTDIINKENEIKGISVTSFTLEFLFTGFFTQTKCEYKFEMYPI